MKVAFILYYRLVEHITRNKISNLGEKYIVQYAYSVVFDGKITQTLSNRKIKERLIRYNNITIVYCNSSKEKNKQINNYEL